jgi:hypothetical protein
VFNQFGEVVRRTGRVKPVEPGALTQEEVITEIIAPGIAQANADLDRRNRDAPSRSRSRHRWTGRR